MRFAEGSYASTFRWKFTPWCVILLGIKMQEKWIYQAEGGRCKNMRFYVTDSDTVLQVLVFMTWDSVSFSRNLKSHE